MTFNKETYWKNKNAGLCVVCGRKPYIGIYCKHHHTIRNKSCKIWHKNHPESNIKALKKRRKKMVEEGRCIRCYVNLDPDMDGDNKKCHNCSKRITGTTYL